MSASASVPESESAETPELWAPLEDSELHIEPLEPFTWKTTLWSLIAWPLPAMSIFFWFGVLWLLHHTFWNVGTMLRLPRFAARMTLWLAGIRVQILGADGFDREQNYVIVGNHVSMFDAPVLASSGVINARSMQDKNQLGIPIYGGFVKMFDEIAVDLRDPESRKAGYEEALRRIQKGWSFGLFPEGQRSYDGKLGKFYDGAFRLAIQAQVPILPGAMRGVRNICPPREWRARPGVVQTIYGKPIPTQGMTLDDVPRLRDRSRRAVNDLLKNGPR